MNIKKIFLLLFSVIFLEFSSQSFIQQYANEANKVSLSNIQTNLQEFEAFGIKTTGSTNNANALNWLKQKYTSFGYSSSEITEHSFTFGTTTSKNLIVTKTGTVYPDTFVIVCGHFDTINGPGVNDNGSGVSVILEAARILKNIPTEYSIKFINFSGEEQGLRGSQAYVNNVVNATSPKMKIKLVLNIDQVGGVAGQTNNTITCERDTNNSPSTNNAASNTATQELMNCVTNYSSLQTNLSYAYSSDYMPFQANNEVITGLYEFNESTYPHSANDTYANMDPNFVFQVAKATTGAVQHFAVASTSVLGEDSCTPEMVLQTFKVYPNPADSFIKIHLLNSSVNDFTFEIMDSSGKSVLKKVNETQIDISDLSSGIYIGKLSIGEKSSTRKIIIQ